MFLVDKQIASARAEYVKWDTCQGRPMVRCPSVPVGSAIIPKTPLGSWECLFSLPLLSVKRAVLHKLTREHDGMKRHPDCWGGHRPTQQGFRSQLVERNPSWQAVGASIGVQSNGMPLLRALGMGTVIEQIGTVIRHW